MEHFCPYCFEKIADSDVICPHCVQDIVDWERRMTHAARLARGLHHPIDEVRMGAIIALGHQGEPHTACALAECAYRFPTMMPQNLQIIESLLRFPVCEERDIALEWLTRHASRSVANLATEVLASAQYRMAEQAAAG